MARKFLYVIVILIAIVIAGALTYRLYAPQLMRFALVPREAFRAEPAVDAQIYRDRKMWIARPDIAGNPTLWVPAGYAQGATPGAAIFFVHPTSYIGRDHWNASLTDAQTNARADVFLRGQASAFNAVGQVWAPRYRQATFGAFLTSAADANRALDLAYRDVAAAFDAFVAQIGPDRPIILAGHSQGALHLTRLLRERIAGKPIARRIVAAYVIGWPVSRTTDLAAIGLPECVRADQSGCLLSWQSFAEPADPSQVADLYDASTGFDGRPRRATPMVCTNPLTGTAGAAAPATANLGTLYPSADLASATIAAGKVGARCADRGFLLIGEAPDLGSYVLPGNNYHVYDYSPVLGERPGRRRAAAGGVFEAMITLRREEFRDALPLGGRLLGLDLGTRTIGTALCDAGWTFASPATLIRRTKFMKDKAALADLIAAQHVRGLVIGLPINLDGTESPRSQSTRAFARNCTDLAPILLWDERWSTVAVERTMIEQDMSRAKRAERIDNLAAAHILQAAIDALVAT